MRDRIRRFLAALIGPTYTADEYIRRRMVRLDALSDVDPRDFLAGKN